MQTSLIGLEARSGAHFLGRALRKQGHDAQAGGVDEGVAALAFLQDPAVAARFHIDTKRLIVMGHSYRGFAAARLAAAHPSIAALLLIAPWSPAQDVPLFTVPSDKFAAAAHSVFDDDEGRMGGYTDVDMAKEILTPGYDWRLETSAEGIKNLPILIVSAKYDSADDEGTELVAALGHLHAADLTTISMDTDHPLSDHMLAQTEAASLEADLVVVAAFTTELQLLANALGG